MHRRSDGQRGACALAAVLSENTELEYLNLENNTFGEMGAPPPARHRAPHFGYSRHSLSAARRAIAGGRAFCAALGVNSTLQYLNLMYTSVPSTLQYAIRERWSSTRESQGVGLHL